MSEFKPPAVSVEGAEFEAQNALRDVQAGKREYGLAITFYRESETTVARDRYNSVKAKSYAENLKLVIMSNPVEMDPSQERLRRSGLAEDTTVILTTAFLDWDEAGIAFDDIDLVRWRFRLMGREYKLTSKKPANIFGGVPLEILVGGKEEARSP